MYFANSEIKNNIENIIIEAVLNYLPISFSCVDIQGNLMGCNKKVLEDLNFSEEQVVGKNILGLITKEAWENSMKVIKERKSLIFEEIHFFENGKEINYLSVKSPLFLKNKVIGVTNIAINITTQKQAEKFQLEKKLAESKTHYTRLAAGTIAHDLRTPLASIQAGMGGIDRYLPLLIDAYNKAKEAGLEVTHIRPNILKSLEGVSQRCNDEISFSHHYINLILGNLNSDEIDTEGYTVHSISPLVQQAVDSYPFKGHESSLAHVDLSQDFQFLGNATYLKNMINNLLKNALYYIADAQKGEIFIETQVNPEAGYNALVFKDTAKGASSQILQNMFKGFYSKRKGGTGLGLAFCKNVMQSFGGDIEARSVEGEYMEFVLTFPKLA